METKTCIRCKEEKDVSMFSKNSRMKDELNCYCKACLKVKRAECLARMGFKNIMEYTNAQVTKNGYKNITEYQNTQSVKAGFKNTGYRYRARLSAAQHHRRIVKCGFPLNLSAPEAAALTKNCKKEWIATYGEACICCSLIKPLSDDHVIPISKGGRHQPENLAFICKSCNSSKSAKDPTEWLLQQNELTQMVYLVKLKELAALEELEELQAA